ncbi:MAG: XRE family transcriptional regulator [Trinickia sp.]|jgi:HTH-type transcriptional regulator/antitoxin HipB|uniref:XRE family transcriptional regulator n=1 Tax=Trinickia sp. TaxID=2571163 RepID=UPI003F80A501
MIIVSTPSQLGEILLSARRAKGLTQAEAAAYLGVGQPRLSLLETTATASLSLDQMLSLFALYDLELQVQPRGGRPSQADADYEPEW